MVDYASSPESQRPRAPVRLVLLSIFGLWLCYFGIWSARGLVLGAEYQAELLWRRSVVVAIGIALTVALWLLLRAFDRAKLALRIVVALIVAAPAAVLSGYSNTVVFEDLQERIITERAAREGYAVRRDESGNLMVDVRGADRGDAAPASGRDSIFSVPDRWQMIAELAFSRYFMFLAWCALYFALLAGERARVAERRESEFREAAKAAELRSLRYQVNPHFLFNTLNSLSALILTGRNDAAEEMVQSIAHFYRQSLTADPTGQVSLAEEFSLLQTYLDLETVRFPERLITQVDLPDALADHPIPGMILQPLVENSVKYAVAPLTRPVTITLAAREEYGRLVLSVEDDGPGTADSCNPGTGIGLDNVRRRLRTAYGKEAHLVSGATGSGYATHIRIPLRPDA